MIAQKEYSYDSAFRITGITDTDNSALSQSYGYDALDRLNSATGTSLNETWTYDANGNRQTQGGASSSTYTVSPTSNQLASISGVLTRTYAYAASGQTTSYGGITFTYMDSGRLSSVSNNGATTTYLFNALGQRVKKSGTSVTLFVYDESGHLLGEYDGSGNLIEETVWMGDVPVATLQPNGTGVSVYYVHTDHLNTPRRITSPSTNAIVWRWDSEPFGTAAANQNPSGSGATFVYNPRFPGQYYDVETGLNYNYFRDYDPGTGRYVESDPIGLHGGISTYAYVNGNPISNRDPSGKVVVPVGTPDEVSTINQALAALSQESASANALIQYLKNNPTDIFIKAVSAPNSYRPHSSCSAGTVSYDPFRFIIGDNPWQVRPSDVGLAHELIHAYHDLTDTLSGNWNLEETNTVGLTGNSPYTENQIRSDYGLPQRPVY